MCPVLRGNVTLHFSIGLKILWSTIPPEFICWRVGTILLGWSVFLYSSESVSHIIEWTVNSSWPSCYTLTLGFLPEARRAELSTLHAHSSTICDGPRGSERSWWRSQSDSRWYTSTLCYFFFVCVISALQQQLVQTSPLLILLLSPLGSSVIPLIQCLIVCVKLIQVWEPKDSLLGVIWLSQLSVVFPLSQFVFGKSPTSFCRGEWLWALTS